jgi:hypothetical protein
MKSKIRLIGMVAVMALLIMTAATVFADGGPKLGAGSGSAAVVEGAGGCDQPAGPDTDGRCITHNSDQTVMSGVVIACVGGGTAETHILRRFNMDDFLIGGTFDVASVDIGLGQVQGYSGSPLGMHIDLYSWDNSTSFVYANFSPIGTADFTSADGNPVGIVNVAVAGTVPASGTLVIDWWIDDSDGGTDTELAFGGGNNSAESDDTFIASAPCGLAEPASFTSIGFPGVAWVANVYGKDNGGGGVTPDPTGRTYEVTPLGGGAVDCWTFGAANAFTSMNNGGGLWQLRGVQADKASWGVKIGSWRVHGITKAADGTMLRASDNSGVNYRGVENSSCGTSQ